MKHMVWNNDVCEMHDEILKNPSDFFPDLDEDEVTDDMAWNVAYEEIENWLGDEVANLDVDKPNRIFLMGILQRWNGAYSVHKDLGTCNIGEAVKAALSCFDGDNSFEIYVEGKRLLLAQRGHDNPVNPSIFEFRVPVSEWSVDDFARNDGAYIMKNSRGLAKDVRKVYGWATRRKVEKV